ncbi:hypothetical protein LBSG162_04980 [Lentilactobacillus buchneri subsp. silagei]|nr:hypothetical protein Ltb232_11540 [Lentilactobacillus buchneri subsp. silagei]GED91393.1 hypothetical protein LBSG162_04980 [Lentilactobacillus buchneri subsp. silagei]GED93765.1 hypothetical protein LBSP_03250 [Lentilactobacillus buchneri subsp. silagei]
MLTTIGTTVTLPSRWTSSSERLAVLSVTIAILLIVSSPDLSDVKLIIAYTPACHAASEGTVSQEP